MSGIMDILEIVRSIYKTKLSNGKSILELSSYNDISMWWTVDTIFYDFINEISRDEDGSRRTNQNKILNNIFKHRKIFINIYKYFGIYIVRVYDTTIYLIIMLIENILNKCDKLDDTDSKPKVLIVAQDGQWKSVYDYETGKSRRSDAFFDPIIKRLLEDGYELVGIFPIDLYPLRGINVYTQKLKYWNIYHKPLNRYYDKRSWICEKNAYIHFKGVWNSIKHDKILKDICIYNGIQYERVIDELEIYFLVVFPHLVKYVQISRNMIQNLKPNLILIINEHYWWERTLISAAELEGIPTLAIQHGVIHPSYKSHNYTKEDISPDGSGRSPYCPIPNKIAVYGSYFKDILTKTSSYPTDSVVVTGQPRYDIISYADKVFSKDKYLTKYVIGSNIKIILWTTQCHGLSDNENSKNLNCIFDVMNKIKGCSLVIKQHPVEPEIYTNQIKKQIETHSSKNIVLAHKSSDTLEHIYNCDLLITRHSTTAMEAVALGKPVIILNLSGEPDPVNYVDEGVALGVYKEEDLKQTIEMLLMDGSALSDNRDIYIKRYLCNIDGEATTRVAEVISSMIKGESI